MRSYCSVKGLCRLSYTCFTGTRVLGQFGETGSEYPKSCAGTHESDPKSLAPSSILNETLL